MLSKQGMRIHRAVWGTVEVTCEECGRIISSHEAIWHGAHPYCSPMHELQDTGELTVLT